MAAAAAAIEPTLADYLYGNGLSFVSRPGNQALRTIVDTYLDEYVAAEKRSDTKSQIVNRTIYTFKDGGSSGWFLQRRNLPKDGRTFFVWDVMSPAEAYLCCRVFYAVPKLFDTNKV